ncbi:hypothetical protein [Mesorhizobium sp. CN2-181]|uniref:hypothetical protein n=1 Tax=Mesorhizobium yinganensis TaxID=3157707 RepID=UPI0032B8789D
MMAGHKNVTAAVRPALLGWKGASLVIALAAGLLLAAANAHLVYVALVSQPDCVPHLQDAGQNGTYRAARSSC